MRLLACLLFLPFILLPSAAAYSQWTINPDQPAAVCDASGQQSGLQVFPDGESGLYVFWLDARDGSSSKNIYGQHYDASGAILWEQQGRLIVDIAEDINLYRVMPAGGGGFHLAWYAASPGINAQDGVYAQRLDAEGAFLWNAPLLLAFESTSGSLSAFEYVGIQLLPVEDGVLVMLQLTTYGYLRIRLTRFNADGDLLMPVNGVEIGPLDYGWAAMAAADGNSAYIYYSAGNGLGAALNVMRVDASANLLWPAWINATADSPGLGYQFGAVGDPDGITLVWEVNQADLLARRIGADGAFTWNAPLVLCNAAGPQNQFSLVPDEGFITAVWRDGRPGVAGSYAIYGQRFTPDGTLLWAQNGMEIANIGSFDPYLVAGRGDDQSILVHTQTSTNGGEDRVHKTLADGTSAYGAEGLTVARSPYITNNSDKRILRSGTNILAVWKGMTQTAELNDLFIARVEDLVTYVDESVTACNSYLFGESLLTASGTYTMELPGDTLLTLHLTIESFNPSVTVSGEELAAYPEDASYAWTDCSTGASAGDGQVFQPALSGSYSVTIATANCEATLPCEEVTVWIDVDSTVTSCGALDLGGILLEESGTYTLPLAGDTLLHLTLWIEELEASISQSDGTLTASPDGALAYSWTDCATGEAVAGGVSFTPDVSGSYAVEITGQACTDLSACVEVEVAASVTEPRAPGFRLFPNPGSGFLVVSAESGARIMAVRIFDMTGRMLLEQPGRSSAALHIPTDELAPGAYLVEVHSASATRSYRWVRE